MAPRRAITAIVLTLAWPAPASANGPDRIAYTSDRGNPGDIYMVALDGSPPRRLTTADEPERDPAVAPDGRTIAYVRNYGELWLMNADGSGQRLLTGVDSERPNWSPDGRRIVFYGIRAGETGNGIYVIDADGTNLRRLTPVGDNPSTMPSFSPDGRTIVFERFNYLWLVDADGSHERVISTAFMGHVPAWSPDGSRIAFEDTGDDGLDDIYTVRPDGSELRRLTTARGIDGSPSWSPDGRRIAFGSTRDGNSEVYVMNADGSAQTRVTHDPDGYGPLDGGPSWDPSSGSATAPLAPPRNPAVSAVRLRIRCHRRQRLSPRGIRLRVRVDRPGRVTAHGAITVGGSQTLRLRGWTRAVRRASEVVVRLRITERQRARVARALRRGGRAQARIRIEARAEGVPAASAVRRVRILRPR